MRSTDAYLAFERRWQLPVYFQLRWKEIVKELEDGLVIGHAGVAGERGRDGYALPQTAATLTAFKSCWSSDIYIPELSFRFWRLSLQVSMPIRTPLQAFLKLTLALLDRQSVSYLSGIVGAGTVRAGFSGRSDVPGWRAAGIVLTLSFCIFSHQRPGHRSARLARLSASQAQHCRPVIPAPTLPQPRPKSKS